MGNVGFDIGGGNMADSEFKRLIRETERRIRVADRAHWLTVNAFETSDRIFTFITIGGGFVVSVLATIPIAFASVYAARPVLINLALFGLGSFTSIAATFQAIFRWGERARDHRVAAGHYTNARRQLEILQLSDTLSPDALQTLLSELNLFSDTTPSVPEAIWKLAKREVAREINA